MTAKYLGNGVQGPSTKTQPYAVVKASTSVAVTVPANATPADEIEVAVSATGTSLVPSGKVKITGTFNAREVQLDPLTGTGVLKLDDFTPGSYRLLFAYQGDDNMQTATKAVPTVRVVKAEPSIVLTPTDSQVVVGGSDQVTVKATVRNASQKPLTGAVTFSGYGDTESVDLVGGVAELTLPANEVGEYDVVAEFAEDDYYTSVETSATYRVVKAATVLDVDVPKKATTADVAKVTVKSTNSSVVPDGRVRVSGADYPDDFKLENGKVDVELARLSPGSHQLVFKYLGDDNTEEFSLPVTVTITAPVEVKETETTLVFDRDEPVAGSGDFSVTATVWAGDDEVVTEGNLAIYVDDQLYKSLIVDGPVDDDPADRRGQGARGPGGVQPGTGAVRALGRAREVHGRQGGPHDGRGPA